MKSDFMLAINQLCTERKLSRDVVLEAVEAALISAYKRNFGSATNIEARIDPNSGEVSVYAIKEVVDDVQDRKTQISVDSARRVSPDAQLGDTVMVESTPRDFGRIAAQTAKQVILQRIREAERDALYSTFVDKAGEIAVGTVQSVEYHTGDVIVNVDGAEALLPAREQVPGERYRRGSRMRAYVVDVRRGNRGPQITLSRRSPSLLGRLLELEVPEIYNGTVEIKGMAREAGSRSKVAVHATQDGVDPVGSCVGVRGGRIQSVVTELGGEKIDVVQWDSDVGTFIANALSPAKVMNVLLDDNPETGKTATVIVPDRQLSLAIGKEGQNARLAAKLTGWRIDIKSATETAEETLGRFEEPAIAPEDMDLLTLAETILRQRTSEEFSKMERVLIRAGMTSSDAEGLPWPEEPPSAEVEPSPETAVSQETEEVESAEPEAAVPELEGAELVVPQSDLPGDGGEEIEVAPPLGVPDEVEALEPGAADESETIPPFDGELVEDSTGWVATEPPPEYQYAWEDEPSTDGDSLWEPRWDEDLLEEEEELELPKTSKKKRKKKGRQHSPRDDREMW
jgi:N utilization substance protein A